MSDTNILNNINMINEKVKEIEKLSKITVNGETVSFVKSGDQIELWHVVQPKPISPFAVIDGDGTLEDWDDNYFHGKDWKCLSIISDVMRDLDRSPLES